MSDWTAGPFLIPAPGQMQRLGETAARGVKPGQVVFLHGDLGAGKTTWVRGALRGLGYTGPVKSPTYTLLEPYYLEGFNLYHFDLYRLESAEELENLAFRDYLDGSGACFVEWPERGEGLLPAPDCRIEITGNTEGRRVTASCTTELGKTLCLNMH